jgi:hypothetical protein
MAGKTKLHEILAVESDVQAVAQKVMTETLETFTKKPDRFTGHLKVYRPFVQEEGKELETEAAGAKKIVTETVPGKLEYTNSNLARWFDVVLEKEGTNQLAKSDVIIEGTALCSDVPATMLLGLETKLKKVRDYYDAIPTLQPGKEWELDEQQGDYIYRDKNVERKYRTEKVLKHRVLVEAQFPKEGEGGTSLPAQVERWQENENVGIFETINWSGMISPAKKSELLGRIDVLIQAVKRARQRANTQEVVKANIGKKLFDFIEKGIV